MRPTTYARLGALLVFVAGCKETSDEPEARSDPARATVA